MTENDLKKQLKQGIEKYKKSIIESEKHLFNIGDFEKILKDNRPCLYDEYHNWKYGNNYNGCADDDCTIKYWIYSHIWERRRIKNAKKSSRNQSYTFW